MRHFIFLLGLCLTMAACQSTETAQEFTDQEDEQEGITDDASGVSHFNKRAQRFTFNSEKAYQIRTAQGTLINVPGNAFLLKKDNSPVKGDVQILFEEYQTKGEIIASGITMVYKNPQGKKEQFESAGMFSITAAQNGQELVLAPGKQIKIDMPSDVPGSFNFYKLTDDRTNWELKETDCPVKENPAVKERAEEIDKILAELPEKPKKPLAYKKGDKLFDIQLLDYYSVELSPLTGMMWKYTGDDPKKDPTTNRAPYDGQFKAIDVIPLEGQIQEYLLVLESKERGSDTLRAAPVYQGKLLDRENKRIAKMIDQINTELNRIQALKEQQKREEKFLRSMNLDELGVWNYDRQFKDPDAIPMFAKVQCDGKNLEDYANFTLFLLPSQKRVVIRYDAGTIREFALNPRESNTLMALLPDGSAYILSPSEVRKMSLGDSDRGKEVAFNLRGKGKPTTSEKLDELLAAR